MPVINHIHTYVKYKGKPGYFKCDAQDCTHWVDKELIVGKLSLCTQCHSQFQLTRDDLRRSRPRCINCSDTQKAKDARKAFDLTRELGTSSFDPFNMPKQLELSEEDDKFRFRIEEDDD